MIDANGYIGTPYEDLDCWHLVREILVRECSISIPALGYLDPKHAGSLLSHCERDYKRFSEEWAEVQTYQAGDLLLFLDRGLPSHAGLVINASQFIHTQPYTGAVVERLTDAYWRSRIYAAYRHRSRAGDGNSSA